MNIENEIYKFMCKVSNKLISNFINSNEKYEKVTDINLDEVRMLKNKYGIGGIVLDIDGTVRKDLEKIDNQIMQWIEFIKSEFKVCIVSNGSDNYIKELSQRLNIEYINFARKPSSKPFISAANKMGLNPENILVIGNEYIADIFGGTRAGMNTALIKDMDLYNER